VSYKKGYSYLWQDNTTDSTYLVSQPGKYSVVVTDSNKCKYYDEITLSQILKPYFDLGKDTAICLGSEVTIRLPINNYMYQWQDGLNSNVYTVIDTGLYVVKATNICGSYKDSIYFKQANCDCSVDVPSAFSPNGDNVNDILYLRGSCVKNIEFYIYDRWGEKVFESHELSNGWDGTFKGKKIDAAVFTFYLSAESELEKGKIFKKEGNISLIR
jgi:gliding motility-associated-like protein